MDSGLRPSPLRGALRASVGRFAASDELATLVRFSQRSCKRKRATRWATLFRLLVEVARIELASASPLLRGLHAYSVINLTACYPTGRENSQPVQ